MTTATTPATTGEVPAELMGQALSLSTAARERLGLMLLGSLEAGDGPEVVRREWTAEVIRRMDAYDRGEMAASDWRESLARVQAKLRERHP